MIVPKTVLDRPAIIVEPRSVHLGHVGHIIADNRSKDNTVRVSLTANDLLVDFDAGSEEFPPQFIVVNHSMISLDQLWRSLPAKREKLRDYQQQCENNSPVYDQPATLLVFRFLALVHKFEEDQDVDIESSGDPEAVYKLLRTRNIIRAAWGSKLIEAIPEWSLPEWEKTDKKPQR
jgi:hypothetical protein